MSKRLIQVMEPLPTYLTPQGRIANMATDVREASAKARKRALEMAQKYTVTGWSTEEDDIEVGVVGEYLVLRLPLTRPN